MELTGTILHGRSFDPIEGRIHIEDGDIVAIEERTVDADRLIAPAFVNAHTHIGDSIAKEAGEGLDLEALVAPPDGLKHRLLRVADPETIVKAMRQTLRFMQTGGTVTTIEFREGGVTGVTQLKEAATGLEIDPVILGRESIAAMEQADGFGASGANDADFTEERAATAAAGKIFGIHAGEVDTSDVDAALDLAPEFIIHGVHLAERHFERIATEEVPIVVCPRSNAATGVGLPPVERQVETTTVALGTDNVMMNEPSMYREMAFTADLFDISTREVLAMATYRGADLIGADYGVIKSGRPAALQVLDLGSDNLAHVQDPVRGLVRRAGRSDLIRTIRPSTADD